MVGCSESPLCPSLQPPRPSISPLLSCSPLASLARPSISPPSSTRHGRSPSITHLTSISLSLSCRRQMRFLLH